MRKLKKLLGSMILTLGLCFFGTVSVSAAEVDMTMNTTASAQAGDTVYAQVVLDKNPGISTMGIRMIYDKDVLTYEEATWHTDISSNGRNMSLVSDIEEDGKNILNISTILDSGYSISGEAIVTVKFTAKQSFTSMPVTLESRDVTDENFANVTVNIKNGNIKGDSGNTSKDTQTPKDTSSESQTSSENTGSSQDNNSGNAAADNSANGDSNNAGSNNSNTGNNNAGSSNTGTNNAGNDNLDKTFKTGAVDARVVLGIIAVVLVGVAAVCIKVLRKREY